MPASQSPGTVVITDTKSKKEIPMTQVMPDTRRSRRIR
jgi:hypothetical protein